MIIKRIYTYNVLNAAQVVFGVLFQFLVARRFGAGAETDVYFLSLTVVTFLSAISLLFSEMFLQHYVDLHHSDPGEGERFYQAVLTQSVLIGAASCGLSLLMMGLIVRLFAPDLDPRRVALFASFFTIHSVTLIWGRAATLNNSVMNAHMRFLLPYLLGMATHVVNIVFLLVFAKSLGIKSLAVAAVVSGLLSVALQQIFIARALGLRMRFRLWHQDVRRLAAQSVSLRVGHQIFALRDVLTTSVLSSFPAGTLSVFSYAMKIITIVFSVTNSPGLQIFQAKASRLMSAGESTSVEGLRREISLKNMILFVLAVGPAAIVLPLVLRTLFRASLSDTAIQSIYTLFLCLIPAHLCLTMEMPFVQVVIALKRGVMVLQTNIVFIAVYSAALFAMLDRLGVYAIPAAMCAAQALNVGVYVRFVGRYFQKARWKAEAATS